MPGFTPGGGLHDGSGPGQGQGQRQGRFAFPLRGLSDQRAAVAPPFGIRACGWRIARFQRVPSQASFTDAPVVTAHPSHRRPGGSSWFTVLPQRC